MTSFCSIDGISLPQESLKYNFVVEAIDCELLDPNAAIYGPIVYTGSEAQSVLSFMMQDHVHKVIAWNHNYEIHHYTPLDYCDKIKIFGLDTVAKVAIYEMKHPIFNESVQIDFVKTYEEMLSIYGPMLPIQTINVVPEKEILLLFPNTFHYSYIRVESHYLGDQYVIDAIKVVQEDFNSGNEHPLAVKLGAKMLVVDALFHVRSGFKIKDKATFQIISSPNLFYNPKSRNISKTRFETLQENEEVKEGDERTYVLKITVRWGYDWYDVVNSIHMMTSIDSPMYKSYTHKLINLFLQFKFKINIFRNNYMITTDFKDDVLTKLKFPHLELNATPMPSFSPDRKGYVDKIGVSFEPIINWFIENNQKREFNINYDHVPNILQVMQNCNVIVLSGDKFYAISEPSYVDRWKCSVNYLTQQCKVKIFYFNKRFDSVDPVTAAEDMIREANVDKGRIAVFAEPEFFGEAYEIKPNLDVSPFISQM